MTLMVTGLVSTTLLLSGCGNDEAKANEVDENTNNNVEVEENNNEGALNDEDNENNENEEEIEKSEEVVEEEEVVLEGMNDVDMVMEHGSENVKEALAFLIQHLTLDDAQDLEGYLNGFIEEDRESFREGKKIMLAIETSEHKVLEVEAIKDTVEEVVLHVKIEARYDNIPDEREPVTYAEQLVIVAFTFVKESDEFKIKDSDLVEEISNYRSSDN